MINSIHHFSEDICLFVFFIQIREREEGWAEVDQVAISQWEGAPQSQEPFINLTYNYAAVTL